MAAKSKEILFLQSIWLKALEQGELTLKFATKQDAHRTRMTLYSAVKAARKGQDEDARVNEAAQTLQITKLDDKTLLFQPRMAGRGMAVLAAALGQEVPQGLMEDPAIAASLERITKTTPQRETPFYTRED